MHGADTLYLLSGVAEAWLLLCPAEREAVTASKQGYFPPVVCTQARSEGFARIETHQYLKFLLFLSLHLVFPWISGGITATEL